MWTQAVTFRNGWVFETIRGTRMHAQTLHDALRALVFKRGERDNVLEMQHLESHAQGQSRTFRGKTASPIRSRQAPPNFHARRERQLCLRSVQSDKAGELRRFGRTEHLQGPKSPAALLDQSAHASSVRVALLALEHRREVAHDFRIRVQRRQLRQVASLPLAQAYPVASQELWRNVCMTREAGGEVWEMGQTAVRLDYLVPKIRSPASPRPGRM